MLPGPDIFLTNAYRMFDFLSMFSIFVVGLRTGCEGGIAKIKTQACSRAFRYYRFAIPLPSLSQWLS